MTNLFQTMQLMQQFKDFASQFQNGKNDPQKVLDQLIQSGKINQQQLDQAKQMAQMFKSFLGGK